MFVKKLLTASGITLLIALMALERAWVGPDARPEELSVEGLR